MSVQRVAQGVPAGGQFAKSAHGEGDVSLDVSNDASLMPPDSRIGVAPLPDVPPTDVAELEHLIGAVAAREFSAGKPHGQAEAWSKMERLATLDGRQWRQEAEGAIYDSALSSRFRGNWEATHAVASYAYFVSNGMSRARGENPSCGVHSDYNRAHRSTVEHEGHNPGPKPSCSCEPAAG